MIEDVDIWLNSGGPFKVLARDEFGELCYMEVTRAQAAAYAAGDQFWRDAVEVVPMHRRVWRALTGHRDRG